MDELKFSVVIPVYNGEKYLKRCIDSLLNQNISGFEIILVDDGSKDNSWRVCREFADGFDNISAFRQENKGVSAARNVGISHAVGKYISFVDCDDWVEKDYFSSIERALGEETADMFFFGFSYGNATEHVVHFPKYQKNGTFSYKKDRMTFIQRVFLDNGIFFSPCNKFYKTEIVRNNRIEFPPGLAIGEDLFFNLQYLFYTEKIQCIDRNLYFYYDNEFSAMHKNEDCSRVVDYIEELEVFRNVLSALNYSKKDFFKISLRVLDDQFHEVKGNCSRILSKVENKKFLVEMSMYLVWRPWLIFSVYLGSGIRNSRYWIKQWLLLLEIIKMSKRKRS